MGQKIEITCITIAFAIGICLCLTTVSAFEDGGIFQSRSASVDFLRGHSLNPYTKEANILRFEPPLSNMNKGIRPGNKNTAAEDEDSCLEVQSNIISRKKKEKKSGLFRISLYRTRGAPPPPPCSYSPCKNGNCTNTGSSYNCTCNAGYTGAQCDDEIDECESNPCQNGGTCIDELAGYTCYCGPHYTGINCETDMCSPIHGGGIDVIFVVDTSLSQTSSSVVKVKDYIRDFISQFPIGPNSTQIGCISYSFAAKTHFHLASYSDNTSLIAAVDALVFEEGTSRLGDTLQIVHEDMLTPINGARNSSVKYVIIMTDGLSSNLPDARLRAMNLRLNNVNVFAICFGDSIHHGELVGLTGSPFRVFSPYNKDGVNTILKRNVMATCPDCYRNYSDVAIAMEMSGDVPRSEFYDRVSALQVLLSTTAVSQNGIRISYTTYGSRVQEVFPFNLHTSIGGVITAMQAIIPELQGTTNASYALNYFYQYGFAETRGARSGHRKVLLFFTNGFFTDYPDVFNVAKSLRDSGVTMVTISTSTNVNMTSLITITSDPTYVFIINEEVSIDSTVLRILIGYMNYDVCEFDYM